MKICTNCGNQVDANAKFCTKCGGQTFEPIPAQNMNQGAFNQAPVNQMPQNQVPFTQAPPDQVQMNQTMQPQGQPMFNNQANPNWDNASNAMNVGKQTFSSYWNFFMTNLKHPSIEMTDAKPIFGWLSLAFSAIFLSILTCGIVQAVAVVASSLVEDMFGFGIPDLSPTVGTYVELAVIFMLALLVIVGVTYLFATKVFGNKESFGSLITRFAGVSSIGIAIIGVIAIITLFVIKIQVIAVAIILFILINQVTSIALLAKLTPQVRAERKFYYVVVGQIAIYLGEIILMYVYMKIVYGQ